jgi:protein tyrosine phosphatase
MLKLLKTFLTINLTVAYRIFSADNFRPYITSFQGNNCTDYINAVFVDGYTHPREYIVTEWPLSNTCSDVWSLVYDHDCSAIVVLCTPSSGTVSNVSLIGTH